MGFRLALVSIVALAAGGCTVDDRAVGVGSLAAGGSGAQTLPVVAPTPTNPPAPAAAAMTEGLPSVVQVVPGAGGSGAGSAESPPPPSAPAPVSNGGAALSVRGRVVDFYVRPMRDVAVLIGSALATTDENGAFAVDGVSAPYDVSLLVSSTHLGAPARAGYIYEGLTRTDPTLQVYAGLPERDTTLTVSLPNVDFSGGDRRVLFGFSSADANFTSALDSEATTLSSTGWTGSATIFGIAHVLEVLGTGGIPTGYGRHQVANLTVRADEAQTVPIDLDQGALTGTTTLSGNVASGSLGDRKNFVILTHADGATLTIVADDAPAAAFAYAVPSVGNTSFTFAAAAGLGAPDPYGVAHIGNLPLGISGVPLSVPNPVSLLSPGPGASAGDGDVFSWSGLGQTARTFVWHLQFIDDAHQDLYVITTRTSLPLPAFLDGAAWAPGTAASWSVETHGNAFSVDALADRNGFLDPFSYGFSSHEGQLNGPARRNGFFTETARRDVTLR